MKKIHWEVPHYKQEGSNTCGLACARMLLGYFGVVVSEKDILKETYIHKFGSWYCDLARLFLKRGFETKVYTINLNIYSPFWAGEKETELKDRLTKRSDELKGLLKKEVERAIEYVDLGGELELAIPKTEMLLELLEEQPIIIPVCRSFLYHYKIDEGGHYIVVNGFDGKKYSILDPGAKTDKHPSKYSVDKDVLEYAWLANNRDSDGYLLEINRPN